MTKPVKQLRLFFIPIVQQLRNLVAEVLSLGDSQYKTITLKFTAPLTWGMSMNYGLSFLFLLFFLGGGVDFCLAGFTHYSRSRVSEENTHHDVFSFAFILLLSVLMFAD